MQKLHGVPVYFLLFQNVPRNKIGTFQNVLSEQNNTEHLVFHNHYLQENRSIKAQSWSRTIVRL